MGAKDQGNILGGQRWENRMVHLGPIRNQTIDTAKTDKILGPEPGKLKKETYSLVERCRGKGREIVESNPWEIFVLVLTFIALFMEDTEILLLTGSFRHTMEYDDAILYIFSALRISGCILFFVDLILGSIFKLNYNCKLVWWLDFISALSMIPLEDMKFENDSEPGSLVAGKALKTTLLLKMLRVVRLVKVIRLLKVMNLGKIKPDQTFVIGDDVEKNKGDQLNADHLQEQLTTMITMKVVVMILLLMFGLPIETFMLGDSCYNHEKTQALVSDSMEQLHIMFTSTQFYENRTECDADPLCGASIGSFRNILDPYLDLYISNITLAGAEWPDVSRPKYEVFNESAVRRSKDLYTHVCFVFDANKRVNCAGCMLLDDCCLGCEMCASCYSGYQPPNQSKTSNAAHMIARAPETYWFTTDLTPIMNSDARSSIVQTLLVVAVLAMYVIIFRRESGQLANALTAPIKALAKDIEDVSQMSFKSSDTQELSHLYEICKIQKSFLSMKGILQTFAKFVPREVVRYLVLNGKDARLDMEACELTIFFSDIAKFTTICERLQSQELYHFLSSYFEEMSRIIAESNGTLIEYVGDAILAVWNAPMHVKDHGCLAICSSLLMQERLRSLREEWSTSVFKKLDGNEVPDCEVRCGLHTAVGYVGNMGSPARMKYGVVGGSLNTAELLEELNKTYGTRILVTEATYRQGCVQEKVLFRLVDYICIEEDDNTLSEETRDTRESILEVNELPAEPKVVAVYEPLGLWSLVDMNEGDYVTNISRLHDKAFNNYRQRLFLQAAEIFGEVVRLCEQNEDDGFICAKPAAVLRTRCLDFALTPPPNDWKYTSSNFKRGLAHGK